MERLARFVVAHPRWVVAVLLLATLGLAAELAHLTLKVKFSDELPSGNRYVQIDKRLTKELDAHETSLLAVRPTHGDVFTPEALGVIRRLTDGVERLPGVVPGSVLSLTAGRAKAVTGDAATLSVTPLVGRTIPSNPEALRALRRLVLSYPMYVGTIVTPDGRGAMILADFRDTAAATRVTAGLEALAAHERRPGIEIYVGGQAPVTAASDQATRGIVPLVALALLIIALVHYEAFRTLQAVFLPLVTAFLSVVWAMGLITLLGYHLTPWTAVTAVLVLSVAAGHAVQILKRYYECYHEFGDNRAAVEASLVRIGPVMVVACLVAAAGFLSLTTFGIPAVRDFGLMAALGILSAMVLELTFIPATRVLLRAPRSAEARRERRRGVLDRGLDLLAKVVLRRPGTVLVASLAGVGFVALGIPRVEVNVALQSWFSSTTPLIRTDRIIRRDFTGTSTIRVLVEGDRPGALLDPRTVQGMADLERVLRSDPGITATLSLADYVQTMNRAMNGGVPASYRVPTSRNVIAQYALLFGADDLSRVVTPDFRAGEVMALARQDRISWVEGLFARLRRTAAHSFPPGVRVEVAGGNLAQMAALNATIVHDKIENMAQIGAVIFLLSVLIFRSLVVGLLVIAPLACAAIVNLGTMGWLGTWLSFATASYTALGVSLGADFAIYFLFRLRDEARVRPLPEATAEAMHTSGRAIVFVATAIAAGNAALLASDFKLWRELGGYMGLMMAVSCLATLTVIPALTLLLAPRALLPVQSKKRLVRTSDPAGTAGS